MRRLPVRMPPGTYAAVEFDSVFENASNHFEYVMLHSLVGEPFRIMRRESTFVMDSELEKEGAR
jgi:hypothetical protein